MIEKAESIESKYRVDYVDSGLPRWLIETAFVCCLLQAVADYGPVMDYVDCNGLSWVRAIVQTFGAVVMYFGLLRGMKSLYRPLTVWWWIVLALNIAGFITEMIPSIAFTVGLPVAVSLMLVYLPLGCIIAFSYRGRLRQVGVWMALFILISEIVPVVVFLLPIPLDILNVMLLEIPTVAVIVIYAWVLRRVLIQSHDDTAKA